MSDALGDALQKGSTPPPSIKPPSTADAANLLNGALEPTDDAPTVISKTAPAGGRIEDQFGEGLRGRRLAHFELIEPIGVGGMAAVIRARDMQLDRQVALKILPPEMAADPENVRRFHQEARSAARLDHENIARVFFCGEDQRLHFIAFEFVEGDNLRTILERRGRLPVGEALHYMLQVAAGLAHAARRGVVHRDIKPSNIIIAPNGRAKLVDMGLARSLDTRHDQGLTQSGVTLGTFDYISPEQALEPRDADVRSDIYSLGCTFYHMLTGQAPVPEGTAAKKLHHHQHVKPPDPRQFVPDLPDEAAVILDRMMAKLPKDRYQTPEHLVHHLYLAARKLGAAAEVPEGVLAVEAALPNPPASRPLVLVAIASIAAILLVFLIEFTASPRNEPAANPVVDSGQDDPSEPRTLVSVPTPPAQTARSSDDPSATTPIVRGEVKAPPTFKSANPKAAELAKFLQENKAAPEIILYLDDLHLSDPDDRSPDLVVTNPTVTIRPLRAGQRPTIRDQYRDDRLPKKFQASLTIRSKRCTIENIRFILNQTGASVPMAMLWLDNVHEVNIRGCEFIQVDPCSDIDKAKDSRMASILAEATIPATLSVRESCFLGFGSISTKPRGNSAARRPNQDVKPTLSTKNRAREELIFSGAASGGQDAIARRGSVRIDADNCLFGPHSAPFRLERAAPGENASLRLNHCSVLASNSSAVFDVADGADALIVAEFSLFSHLGESSIMGMSDGAVFLRRATSQGEVHYQGHENRYHRFDDFLVVADAIDGPMQSLLDEMSIRNSDKLEKSPWTDSHPFDSLNQLAIQSAFSVDAHLPQLRVPREERKKGELIGAERVLAFSYLDDLPQPNEAPAVPSRRELVVSLKKPDATKRLYPTLDHALLDVQPGDTIRLQIDGEIKLDSRRLNRENLTELTIRADPGFHPILTLKDEETGNDSALFSIFNGKLQLEGLEIRLRPRGEDDWCAVISFFGDGECFLKGCLVTLERSGRKAVLAALPHERMKKATAAAKKPRLIVENCFVRGHGDLLWMQDGHAAEVSIDNSLIALSGSLLSIVSDKQPQTTARDKEDLTASAALLTLHLRRVTTYLGDNLIHLHAAKDIKALPRTRCEPVDCLFLPARDRALVRLDGPEAEEKGLREKFSWESSGRNGYGVFTALLEQQAVDSIMNWPTMSNQDKWQREVSRESSSKYNIKLADLPETDAAFAEMLPVAFRLDEGLQDLGVDLAALRALPVLKGKTNAPEPDTDYPDLDN